MVLEKKRKDKKDICIPTGLSLPGWMFEMVNRDAKDRSMSMSKYIRFMINQYYIGHKVIINQSVR